MNEERYYDGVSEIKEARTTKAHSIELQAERRGGELLIGMKRAGQLAPGRNRNARVLGSKNPGGFILDDFGVSRNESRYWQMLARIPEREWQELLARVREIRRVGNILVTKEIEKAAKRADLEPVSIPKDVSIKLYQGALKKQGPIKDGQFEYKLSDNGKFVNRIKHSTGK
jgi:hypothetical protein